MHVIHLNQSDTSGGAARAAYRIHHALRSYGFDSRMYVSNASAGDWTISGPANQWEKVAAILRGPLGGLLTKFSKTGNPIIRSPAFLPSRWSARLNASNADVVHLHWVGSEMISIADIGRIRKPVVWTLHDMWAFSGAEHLSQDNRWREGYLASNRPPHETRFDLNRWTWRRKLKHWKRPMQIVTPSRWLANCARQSALMRDWPVTVIPNPIDTELWQPVAKGLARHLLGLPTDTPLIAFGALGANAWPHKGYDLLQSALHLLGGQLQGIELVVFGQLAPRTPIDVRLPIHYIGHLHDDISLRLLYSAADALVIPSRTDNLPNTGIEALACGTPVIAFNTCGLPDVIEHQKTGYLANAFEAEDLARGIHWILSDTARHKDLSQAARERAVQCFDYAVIAPQYEKVYRQALESHDESLKRPRPSAQK